MTITLPDELSSLLNMLGFMWPNSDEVEVINMGQEWMNWSATLQQQVTEMEAEALAIWGENSSDDVAAFQEWWEAEDSPKARLLEAVEGAQEGGNGLLVAGMIILGLKIAVIVQLTILAIGIAKAIAAAAPTFGASLGVIPVLKISARVIIGLLVEQAIWAILT